MSGKDSFQISIDLGTTRLNGRLNDSSGVLLGEHALDNSQIKYGSDVIRRLEQSRSGQGEELRKLLVQDIKGLVAALLSHARVSPGAKHSLVVAAAGNPAICHLLLELPVDSLLFPPHKPKDYLGRVVPPDESGLGFPFFLFPLVSGYVGGDLIACLYALEDPLPGTLLVDLGTNAEIALKTEGGWMATSVAAGPAFEGGDIRCGMRATSGAITGVRVADERLVLEVVGEGRPQGVCGSGLVAAVSAALEGELLSPDGTLLHPGDIATNLSRYVVEGVSGRELVLYRDARQNVCLTQHDIRQFQLAKGAVLAGVKCLLQKAGFGYGDVPEVIVTGALGHGIPYPALKRVALLPEKMVDKVRFTPSGVLDGLQRFLLQADGPEKVAEFVETVKPYPLSGTPTFERAFLDALNF